VSLRPQLLLVSGIGDNEQNPLEFGSRILRAATHFHDVVVAYTHQESVSGSQAEGLAGFTHMGTFVSTLVYSDDGGDTWKSEECETDLHLRDVFYGESGFGIAVGDSGSVFKRIKVDE